MTIYRIRKGSNTWHWCTNCPNWPNEEGEYDEKTTDRVLEDGKECHRCQVYNDAESCDKR